MKRTLFVIVFILATTALANDVVVSFLDVGQGDAMLIRSPEGKTALIDAGPSSKNIPRILQKEGVHNIDLLIISHHHADHYGGMSAVVEKYKPTVCIDSGSSKNVERPSFVKLISAIKKASCKLTQQKCNADRRIELGTVMLRLFPQPPENKKQENNNSIGIRLEFGKFSVLLTGDSEKPERDWWQKNADATLYRSVTVLKVAHHGSRNGIDIDWLKATNPRLAVISCGKHNRYGHPNIEILDLLKAKSVPIKRTDVDGTIRIESDGKTWKILPKESKNSLRKSTLQLAA